MKYRQVNQWRLSAVGYGCYGLSGAYGPFDREAFIKIIQEAYTRGVNFFDTAEGYGDAEAVLGVAVAPFRDQVVLATKLSGTQGRPDLSTSAVTQACEASLQRLNTDVIDLYQVHFDDPDTPVLETVAALESLVAVGKIRRYGVSHLPVSRVRDYAEAGNLFSVMMELSPVAHIARQGLLPICQEHDLAVLAFSITGRGVLSGQVGPGYVFDRGDIRRMDPLFQRERLDSALQIREALAKTGERYGCTAVQMGIAWVLAQPQVACALTGTSSSAHLLENLQASEIDLEAADLAAINRFLEAEEITLAAAQKDTVRRLLIDSLASDCEAAIIDLIYVLETAVMLGWVDEAQVLPVFMELMALRKDSDQDIHRKLHGIQLLVRNLVLHE